MMRYTTILVRAQQFFHSVSGKKGHPLHMLAWLLFFFFFCQGESWRDEDGIIRLLLLFISCFWSGRYLNFYLCLLFLPLFPILWVLFLLVVLTDCVLYDVVACNLLTLPPLLFLFFPVFIFLVSFSFVLGGAGWESIADTDTFLSCDGLDRPWWFTLFFFIFCSLVSLGKKHLSMMGCGIFIPFYLFLCLCVCSSMCTFWWCCG